MPDVGLRIRRRGEHERVGRGLRLARLRLPRRQLGGERLELRFLGQRQAQRRAADGQLRLRLIGNIQLQRVVVRLGIIHRFLHVADGLFARSRAASRAGALLLAEDEILVV